MSLGPVPCQGCRLPVTLHRGRWHDTRGPHYCNRDVAVSLCHTCGGIIDSRGTEIPDAVRGHQRTARHQRALVRIVAEVAA